LEKKVLKSSIQIKKSLALRDELGASASRKAAPKGRKEKEKNWEGGFVTGGRWNLLAGKKGGLPATSKTPWSG